MSTRMSRGERGDVLFVCVHNSARSQMAAALLNAACAPAFHAESAGFDPGKLSPLAVASMREIGIDISGNATQSVFDLFKNGHLYAYVITVCDEATAETCPIFPGIVKRLHWSIPDPARLEGAWEQRLVAARDIRDTIAREVASFCMQHCALETLAP